MGELVPPPLDASVVICTHNRSAGLRQVLDALGRQEQVGGVRWEVLVVDNNSTDDTRAVVKARMAVGDLPLRYAFEPRQGKSCALNRGIRETTGEVIVFTDDDVTIPAGWLAAVLAPFADAGCDGACGPVEPVWEVAQPVWASEAAPYRMMAAIVQYRNDPGATTIAPPVGANCAYRRRVFDDLGGFREDLGHSGTHPMPGEDIEFGRRILHSGRSIRYSPAAGIFHPVTATRLTRDYFERWYFQRGRLEAVLAPYELPPGIPQVAGIPRYLFRDVAAWMVRWLGSAEPKRRFYSKLRALMAAGAISEFYRQRGSRPAR